MNEVLFEVLYKSHCWRLTLTDFNGEQRLQFWAHYEDRATGEWKHCGGKREHPGCIIPLDRADELAEALNGVVAQLRSLKQAA